MGIIYFKYALYCWCLFIRPDPGVDLYKILEGQTQILRRKNMVKTDKCMSVSQILGGEHPGCPSKVCAYETRQEQFKFGCISDSKEPCFRIETTVELSYSI